jgi:hypothetical protein
MQESKQLIIIILFGIMLSYSTLLFLKNKGACVEIVFSGAKAKAVPTRDHRRRSRPGVSRNEHLVQFNYHSTVHMF